MTNCKRHNPEAAGKGQQRRYGGPNNKTAIWAYQPVGFLYLLSCEEIFWARNELTRLYDRRYSDARASNQ